MKLLELIALVSVSFLFEITIGAIAKEPSNLSHHCHLAEILWQMERKDDALERLQIVIRTTRGGHNYPWVWEKVKEWSLDCDRPEFAAHLVRELVTDRPDDAQSWYFLADTLPESERDECLAALERAIALNPYYVDAYDLKARFLSRAEDYEAALAACHPPVWSEDRPSTLKARAVWVQQQCGNHQDAMNRLLELVDLEPDYEWAWQQLAYYFRRLDRLEEYLPATQQLVRIDPNDPVNWGYLGDACHRTGDRDGARVAWEKAIELSPSYDFAAVSLFDLHWEDGNFDAATATLTQLKPHLQPVSYLSPQIRVAVRDKDYPAARSALEQLCHCDIDDLNSLRSAIRAMVGAGFAADSERILYAQLSQDTVSPAVQFIWLEAAAELELWSKMDAFVKSVDFQSDMGERVMRAYLRLLADKQRKKPLLKFVRQHQQILRAKTSLWGYIGYLYRLIQANVETVEWLKDWKQRPDVEPWMIGNLNEAIRTIGDGMFDGRASRICLAALELPSDNGKEHLIQWLAFDLAYARRKDSAMQYLEQISSLEESHPEYQFLIEITLAAIASQCRMNSRAAKLDTVRQHLAFAKDVYPQYRQDGPFFLAYFYAMRRIFYSTFSFSILGSWIVDEWRESQLFALLKRIFQS